jgi:hypothetical protein
MVTSISKQDHALAGNFDPLATLQACDHVIYPNHVVSGILKPDSVIRIGTRRQRRFLGSGYPSDLILRILTAGRTAQGHRLRFRFLGEKIFLLHLFSFAAEARHSHSRRIQNLIQSLRG